MELALSRDNCASNDDNNNDDNDDDEMTVGFVVECHGQPFQITNIMTHPQV